VTLARTAALLVLLDAFVAVLVVDLAGFLTTQDIVGFGDFDKLLICGFVSTSCR
jgi:hypothetical protein